MQQSSIDYLTESLYNYMEMKGDGKIFDQIYENAKALQKLELEHCWNSAIYSYLENQGNDFKTYYKEKYGSNT